MTEDVEQLLQKGRRSLEAAGSLLRERHFDFAASRAYYAMFYHAEALLLSRGFEAGSHAGVIGLLHREFVRTGRLPHVHGAALERAWKDRTRADYQADTVFTEEDARLAVDRARAFLTAVEVAPAA